jgi:hypothetical protein
MIDDVIDWLNTRCPEVRRGGSRLTGGIVAGLYRNSAKVTLIIFDRRGVPAAIVKAARRESAEASLTAEYEALRTFGRLRCPSVLRFAPQALALGRVGRQLVLAQTPLTGTPMTAHYYVAGHTSDRRRVAHDFANAARWLHRFQHDTLSGYTQLDRRGIDCWVGGVIARYQSEIGWSAEEATLFESVARRALELEGTTIPLVGVHGDFWMGNLLVDGGLVRGVVDWELARLSGLPFADIYKFPTSYGLYLDRAYPGGDGRVPGHPGWQRAHAHWRSYGDWGNLTGFGYSYFGRGWFPELVRGFVEQRFAALSIDPRLNGVFFPLFLAEQAMTLDDPVFRNGYRSALRGFSSEKGESWLWKSHGVNSTEPDRSWSWKNPIPELGPVSFDVS